MIMRWYDFKEFVEKGCQVKNDDFIQWYPSSSRVQEPGGHLDHDRIDPTFAGFFIILSQDAIERLHHET